MNAMCGMSALWGVALWQALLAVCLILPLVQPWLPAPVTSVGIPPGGALPFDLSPIDVAPPARSAFPVGQAVAAFLVLGALARLGWLGLGFARLARLRRAAVPLDPLPPSIDRAVGLSGARATLALSDGVDGPVTFGLRRPVVLLPRGFLDLAPDFQTTVVCHELAHVRRRDWAWTVGEALVTAAFWFHPAVWWLVAEIQLAREAVIDREVVEITGARRPYVEALVYLASEGARPAIVPAIPMLGRRHLARRMRLLLSEVPMSKTRLVVSFVTIVLTLALAGRYTVWAFPLTGPAPAAAAMAADGQQAPPAKFQAGERAPRKVKDVRPIYPAAAKEAGVQGVVILEVTIETDGTVSNARVLRSVPMLDEAAVDAALQWQFEETGRRLILAVTVNFKLDEGPAEEARTDRVKAPVKLKDVRPVYPEEARKAGVEGVVIVEASIAPDGTVSAAKVLRSIPMLDQAALDAVRQWLFSPPGRAVVTTVTIRFTLDDTEKAAAQDVADAPKPQARMDVVVTRKPKVLHEVKPRYTRALMETGVEGEVVVELQIDTDGTVKDARVLSGPEALREAALEAANEWRFEPPGTLTTVEISFTFTVRS